MNLTKGIEEEYLRRCAESCNKGGYTRLERDKERISEEIIEKYSEENREEISKIETEVFLYLKKLRTQKPMFRVFSWSDINETELRNRIDKSLQ